MNPPELIYLQWWGDVNLEEMSELERLDTGGIEATWCADKIYEHDVEYVRKDLFDNVVEKADALLQAISKANALIASGHPDEAQSFLCGAMSALVHHDDATDATDEPDAVGCPTWIDGKCQNGCTKDCGIPF
jgi:hypothetical protein